MSNKKYYQKFKEAYSKEFKFILKSSKGNEYAFCSICSADFKISHSGRGDIVAHCKTKKHVDQKISTEGNVSIKRSFFPTENNSVIRAECLMTAFIIEHNLPLSTSDHIGPLLRKMFPNNEVAKKYGCARTKTAAIVKQMGAEEENIIIKHLQSKPFSISTDGSNDSDNKLYPMVVTFFEESSIETCLLSLPVLEGDSTGLNIGNMILNNLKSRCIPIENCIALGCDNAPVMIGHKQGVASVLKGVQPELFVMGCLCHLINLAADKGGDSLPVKIDEILVDIFYYLEKSSKRKESFKNFQMLHDKEARKILKHVQTRWLSLGKCLVRLFEQWEPLLSFFEEEKKNKSSGVGSLESYTIPKKRKIEQCSSENISSKKSHPVKKVIKSGSNSKVQHLPLSPVLPKTSDKSEKKSVETKFSKSPNSREERLHAFLSSDLNKAFCSFLISIVPVFDKVNTLLQTKEPLIHNLRSILLELLKEVFSKFVLPKVVKEKPANEVLYNNPLNQKTNSDLVVGYTTEKIVSELSDTERNIFYASVRKYFSTVCDYMIHKFPFNNDILINATVANVSTFTEASFSSIKFFIEKFPVMLYKAENESMDNAMDKLHAEFCDLQVEDLSCEILEEKHADKQWTLISKMQNGCGKEKYPRLSYTALSILTIPHSNAECERIFSQVRKIRTEFRSFLSNAALEKLLITKCRRKGKCYEENFDEIFLKKAKTATISSLRET